MVIFWMFFGVWKQTRLVKISSASPLNPLNFSNFCGMPILHDIVAAKHLKMQVAVPDKVESFIVDQVHILILPNVRGRYKPCLTKFYCYNYAMLRENFLKTFSKGI